ncbi:MAG: MBL fold metallo-hydrolase [Bacteroidota bacterium]
MKLTFLGTGTSQGVPVITCTCEVCRSPDPRDKRLRCSVLLEVGDKVIVIDTGPDFRQQMLREQVMQLDGVVFTHPHKDHIAGMDDVRAFNFRQRRPMDIYANELTLSALKREYAYVFAEDRYPGIPDIRVHLLNGAPFEAAGIELIPIPVMHYKMPVLGFRIGDLAYITDANYIPPESLAKLHGVKVLVLNALRKTEHLSHFSLSQAIAMSRQIGPQHTYLTHISHLMGRHAIVSEELPANVTIAHDGLSIAL